MFTLQMLKAGKMPAGGELPHPGPRSSTLEVAVRAVAASENTWGFTITSDDGHESTFRKDMGFVVDDESGECVPFPIDPFFLSRDGKLAEVRARYKNGSWEFQAYVEGEPVPPIIYVRHDYALDAKRMGWGNLIQEAMRTVREDNQRGLISEMQEAYERG